MSQTNMYLDCPKCKSTLQYPCGATLVRCPSCHWITNTTAPQQLPCISCHTLLAFPPHSLYIRCPKCFVTIHIREHQYKNELLSNKDSSNIMYRSYPNNAAPLLRIDPHLIGSNPNNNSDDITKLDMTSNTTHEHEHEHEQRLKEIVLQHPSIKCNRKYKYFDADLLDDNDSDSDEDIDIDDDDKCNDDNDESVIRLPQLNAEKEKQKRIFTAFQCFCKGERVEMMKNNCSMSEIQICNQLAINWKQMNREQRQKYVNRAQKIVADFIGK